MAGLTNYTVNNVLDALIRGQALLQPAGLYVALCSTQPTASAAGTELAGAGYARAALAPTLANWSGTQGAGTTAVSNGTSRTTRNNVAIDFGTAGANWGLAAHWELYDAVTGGNRLLFGEITDGSGVPSARNIVTNDPVIFPISALFVQLS